MSPRSVRAPRPGVIHALRRGALRPGALRPGALRLGAALVAALMGAEVGCAQGQSESVVSASAVAKPEPVAEPKTLQAPEKAATEAPPAAPKIGDGTTAPSTPDPARAAPGGAEARAATQAKPTDAKSARAKSTEGESDRPESAEATADQAEPAGSRKEQKAARSLGIDLTSSTGEPLEIDARVIDIVDAPEGGQFFRFSGDVRLVQGQIRLTCDRLDAYYPEGAQGSPQRIVAQGAVKVTQAEVELTCERAEFAQDSCVTICLSSVPCESGERPERPARLQRGRDSIEGRKLEFDLCTGGLSAPCGARMKVVPGETPASTGPGAP